MCVQRLKTVKTPGFILDVYIYINHTYYDTVLSNVNVGTYLSGIDNTVFLDEHMIPYM